jgi:methylenetetrahydrofolate--tRNA-(uracil-5-)-methyltransferase
MNINFGLLPPLPVRVRGKRNKNLALSERSLAELDKLMEKEVFAL